MVQKRKKPRQRRNREETERRLIDVALDLIQKNGVLAGLNLREVADGSGVNRGNIYHHFGSRQLLLRAAINRRFEAAVDSLTAGMRGTPFVARGLRIFRGLDGPTETLSDSKLRALLVLDGDDTVDPMPRYEGALSLLRQDVIDGDIDRAHDLEALQVALVALTRGYRIFRVPFAKRVGIDAAELDVRVARILRTWLEAMAQPPAANQSDPEEGDPEEGDTEESDDRRIRGSASA